MAGGFKGKVAVVTGSGSGIGRASARAFAGRGARVVVSDIDAAGGEETVKMIKQAGGEAIFVKTDVSKAAEVKALIDKVVKTYGRLDFAHNNAGVEGSPGVNTADTTEETWDRVMNINLKGIWLCMKYEIPQMLKQKRGAIVNTTSTFYASTAPGIVTYTVSKHGVAGLTRTAALEYGKDGIRINALAPGPTKTPLSKRFTDGMVGEGVLDERVITPLERWGTPEEIANGVVWLCSDEASFCVGTILVIDGGQLLPVK